MMPISGSAGGGGPSAATTASNSSGWTVNFGSGGVNAGGGGELAQYLPFAVLMVGALLAISYLKRRK